MYLAARSPAAIVDRVNDQGETLLHVAIRFQESVHQIENLILFGANLNTRDRCGLTPHHAANPLYPSVQIKHLLTSYWMRHRHCNQAILPVYSCLRRRGVCKDIAQIIIRMVWDTRNDHPFAMEFAMRGTRQRTYHQRSGTQCDVCHRVYLSESTVFSDCIRCNKRWCRTCALPLYSFGSKTRAFPVFCQACMSRFILFGLHKCRRDSLLAWIPRDVLRYVLLPMIR